MEEEGVESQFQIVGVDEIDLDRGKISWKSPLGRALMGKEIDEIEFETQRERGR